MILVFVLRWLKFFEDTKIRQQAKEVTVLLYKHFGDSKDRGFKDQILRASVSIMNNIAEGYERKTEKDRKRFMVIAKGSCAEVRSMIHLGKELGYIDEELFQKLLEHIYMIGKMLYGLISVMKGD